MSKLKGILEDTLEEIGAIKPPTLGRDNIRFSKETKDKLLLRLEEEAKFNNKMIVAIIILHFLLFALAVFLVYYFLEKPEVIVYLFGGSIFSMMIIMYSLIKLWKAKIANDNLRTILPNLPPEQAVEVLKSVYFDLAKNAHEE